MDSLQAGGEVRIDQEKALEWLNSRWGGPKHCPVCKANEWGFGERIIAALPYIHGGVSLGGHTHPLVVLNCNNCGHTLFFNAITMGLFPTSESQEQPGHQAGEGDNE